MNDDSNRRSFKNDYSQNYTDNNIYEDDNVYNYNINHNEYIVNKLKKQNNNLKDTFDELLVFKQKHNIDDRLHTSITTNNISSEYDNYNYLDKQKNTSFWDMLFSPPKHYELMNKIGNHPYIYN